MAIVTGELYKGFTFGDISSKTYGVYITQEAAYNAPERDTEVVEIAGRNGAYILDKGRYKNITVSYKCGIALDSEQTFESAIRTFRNALSAKAGKYVRLEDEYNPNEYRQAAFLGGIDVNMTDRRAGEFTVSFDAKPQRFLKSGETAVTIGGDVTNPQTESGSIVSIEGTGADKVTSLVAQIEPVQSGSGDPSPTNVRAIAGHTACNVNVAVKNLITVTARTQTTNGVTFTFNDDGSVLVSAPSAVSSRGAELNFKYSTGVRYLPVGVPLTVSGGKGKVEVRACYNNGSGTKVAGTSDGSDVTFTIPDNAGTTWARVRVQSGFQGEALIYPMVRVASDTDATWEAINGTIYPVSFGSAGTVYGGTVDVVTGVLKIDRALKVFNGSENISAYGAFAYGARFVSSALDNNSKINQTTILTNRFGTGDTESHMTISSGSSRTNFYIKTGDIGEGVELNAANFKAWLASNNLQVVYELATPQTYQLPAQQVELLTGQNYVWSDTGDITITWGDDPNKLVNPTLYNAHPLLSFTASGSGTININSDTIAVTNQPIGDIILANVTKLASGESVTWSDTGRYQTGDAIRIDSIPAVQTTVVMDSYSYANYTNYISDDMDYLSTASTARGIMIQHSIPSPPQFVAGTARSVSYTARVIDKVKHKTTGDIVDCTTNLTVTIAYDGAHSITATTTVTASLGTASTTVTIDTVTVNSTKPSLTGTAYIDLDIGEAYSIDGGAVVSINDSVSLGASLPVLKPSNNTISKTGAVANLTIIPRWWEL